MSEEETLGKLAYEAYEMARYGKIRHPWNDMPDPWRQAYWIAAAKAVAEHVLQEVQTSVEASE